MTEKQKLIILIIVLFLCVIGLLFTFLYTRKTVKKEREIIKLLEDKTHDYYLNLVLKDDRYFPYFHTHAAGLRGKRKSSGDKDNITDVSVDKNKVFYFDRILYVINNQLNYKFDKITIDGQEYIVLDDKIKSIELLVSFEKPSHFLVKYNVIKEGKYKYRLELIEENEELQ